MSDKRLIETAFPLAEASAASLHEKNMRHGHISTLHLWPARRPLAASRAAIVAALLPDPGEDEARKTLVRRLGGRLRLKKQTKAEAGNKVDATKVEGDGGILWWGQENLPDTQWFCDQIRSAHGGRAPRVLDPFAGGGAIPLEAMRLGCDVVANDLNPVAWFILKCTIEYPQRLAGQVFPLPSHAMTDRVFAEEFLKSQGMKKGANLDLAVARMAAIGRGEEIHFSVLDDRPWERAGLSWHVRAWGRWVLSIAKQQLAERYPIYLDWQTLEPEKNVEPKSPKLVPSEADPDKLAATLNSGLTPAEQRNPLIPRWVTKVTVAYLWARTVRCKSCRATIPMLKTRWLCKKDGKRVVLEMAPNCEKNGVIFEVRSAVPEPSGTAAQRREMDKVIGGGTMSRAGVTCPCCKNINKSEDIRYAAVNGDLGSVMTAVIVDGPFGKEYRRPTTVEVAAAEVTASDLESAFESIQFGIPYEIIPVGGSRTGGGSPFTTPQYGLTRWADLFTARQLTALATLVRGVRMTPSAMEHSEYPEQWREAIWGLLALVIDRTADYGSTICSWHKSKEHLSHTFARFALPIVWDFTETNPLSGSTGDYLGALEWVAKVTDRNSKVSSNSLPPRIECGSAMQIEGQFDAIITDPPYYDAIPYSDLMDFFYVWLRRTLHGMSEEVDRAFAKPLGPKWDHDLGDGELIDDASRFRGDKTLSKKNFEDGMAAVFRRCHAALTPNGILVIVFANKNPEAWETLVAALIRAGFVVDGSLPIQTEMGSRTRAQSSAALSSSVWLVCRKRPSAARPGFAGPVLAEMRARIGAQMHRFWDAGVRGPDFVWAATGPALEAYSRHPVVRRETSASGNAEMLPVADFLREVRRLVVEFAVGRVLKPAEGLEDGRIGLDDITTYYVLHRDTFNMADAPIGACILYALSCNLKDDDLTDRFEILARVGGKSDDLVDDDESSDDIEPELETEGTGSKVRLRRWDQRKRKTLGLEGVGGRPVPMIDRLHRLMQLWKAGDITRVNSFLEQAGLIRDTLFAQLVQALIELANRDGKGDEAPILESISNHLRSRAGISTAAQPSLV